MESHGYNEPILFSLLTILTIFAPFSSSVCLPENPSFPPFGTPPLTSPAYSPDSDDPKLLSPAYPPDSDFSFSDYIAPAPDYNPPSSSPAYSPDSPFFDYSPEYSPASAPDFLFSPDYAPSSANGIDVNPELDKICRSTDYYELCVRLISPVLKGKTDVVSVFRLAVKVAADGTREAIAAADKLALDKGNSAELSSIIGDCKDSYTDSIENYGEALSALPAKDVGTMSSMLSASITDFSDCDDFLTGYKSPLLDYNSKLTKLTSNCLAIASLIE